MNHPSPLVDTNILECDATAPLSLSAPPPTTNTTRPSNSCMEFGLQPFRIRPKTSGILPIEIFPKTPVHTQGMTKG
jgi:hypothetical protein